MSDPTPEEIQRVQEWQAAQEAEREAARKAASEARRREEQAKIDAKDEALRRPFMGQTLVGFDVDRSEVWHDPYELTLRFANGATLTLTGTFAEDREIEIEITEPDA